MSMSVRSRSVTSSGSPRDPVIAMTPRRPECFPLRSVIVVWPSKVKTGRPLLCGEGAVDTSLRPFARRILGRLFLVHVDRMELMIGQVV